MEGGGNLNTHSCRTPSIFAESGVELWRRQYILAKTMGASQAFELRRQELSQESGNSSVLVSNEEVAESYLRDIGPGGTFSDLLLRMKLVHRIGNTIFLHGGITLESFGQVPGDPIKYVHLGQWIARLNDWYRNEVQEWQRDPGAGKSLMNYPVPDEGRRDKPESVVYGRNVDQFNNPLLPDEDGLFEIISGDNSYSSDEGNTAVMSILGTDLSTVDISGKIRLPDGRWIDAKSELTLGQGSPLGKKLVDGAISIAHPSDGIGIRSGEIVGFRSAERFKVINQIYSITPFGCESFVLSPDKI